MFQGVPIHIGGPALDVQKGDIVIKPPQPPLSVSYSVEVPTRNMYTCGRLSADNDDHDEKIWHVTRPPYPIVT